LIFLGLLILLDEKLLEAIEAGIPELFVLSSHWLHRAAVAELAREYCCGLGGAADQSGAF